MHTDPCVQTTILVSCDAVCSHLRGEVWAAAILVSGDYLVTQVE